MIHLPIIALASDGAMADAILARQSRLHACRHHLMLSRAIHDIRRGELDRQRWERRGILLSQSGELWEALNNPTLIEGESCWSTWG